MKVTPIKSGIGFFLIGFIYSYLNNVEFSLIIPTAITGFFYIFSIGCLYQVFPKKRTLISIILSFLVFLHLFYFAVQALIANIFHTVVDDFIIIDAIFNTSVSEASEFFIQYYPFLLAHLIVFLLLFLSYWYFFITKITVTNSSERKKYIYLHILPLIIIVLAHFNPGFARGNPILLFLAKYKQWQGAYIAEQNATREMGNFVKGEQIKFDCRIDKKKNTVVWVIGESDTRHNWSLYGYKRNTNPKLSKIKNELLLFNDVLAAYSSTDESIRRMLTQSKAPSIIQVAQKCHYKVFWVSNQSSDIRGIMSVFSKQVDQAFYTNSEGFRGKTPYDDVIFDPYKQVLSSSANKKFIIVHLMGEHPSYFFRFPKSYAYFNNKKDDIYMELKKRGAAFWAIYFRDLYDNAILFDDYVLSHLIEILKDKSPTNSIFLYTSDHGQDVSHHTNFSGHNHLANEQWEIPFFIWANDLSTQRQKRVEFRPYQTDKIYHTLLGVLKINGGNYNQDYDLLSIKYNKRLNKNRMMENRRYVGG